MKREVNRLCNAILPNQISGQGLDLEAAEMSVRSSMHRVGAVFLEKLINADGGGQCGAKIKCDAGHDTKFINCRTKKVVTVLGKINVVRAYHYCSPCQTGVIPKDDLLDIAETQFSPGVRRMMALVGAKESFDAGRDDLKILAGINVTDKDVERISEAIGEGIEVCAKKNRQIVIDSNIICNNVIPLLPKIKNLYAAMDGTGVPATKSETAGRKGKDKSGIAKTREAKLGVIFTQTNLNKEGKPVRDENSTTYTGGIETKEEFGKRIFAEALRRGALRAERFIVLGDGALWIWELTAEYFPKAIQILDFFHAAEYLAALAKIIHADNKVIQDLWLDTQRTELHDGDVENVIDAMKRIEPKGEVVSEELRTTLNYFENNRLRMRYAEYQKQGYFIGSGVMEAGCKTIVGQRLKQSGMRWTVRGANAIIALRCCQMSNQWEDYWENRAAA